MKNKKIAVILVLVMILSLISDKSLVVYATSGTVSGIEMLTEPQRKEYCVGDEFQTRGMSFVVTYTSGESVILTKGYDLDYDFSTPGEQVVKITYIENGVSVSTNYAVTVFEKPVLSTNDKEVMQGETFTVPVSISKNCGIMGIEILVEYDKESLVPISIDNKEFFGTSTVEDSIDTSLDDSFRVIWAGTENITTDGKLFDITFLCKENASVDGSVVTIKSVGAGTYNENYSMICCVEASSSIKVQASTNLHKKMLTNLMVTMKDWTLGEKASVPVVSGNDGNGDVAYYYASQADGIFSETVPTTVGEYILKIVVAESEEYNAGIATCTFEIKKKEELTSDKKDESTTDNGSGTTTNKEPGTTPDKKEESTTDKEPEAIPDKKEESTTDKNEDANENNNVTLAKPVIKSLKNVKGKKVVLRLKKKIKNASGYEIRYSTKKNMKSYKKTMMKSNSKLSKNVSKLKKGKTYYFKVRAYKKVNETTYYSKWSAQKKVKIKK